MTTHKPLDLSKLSKKDFAFKDRLSYEQEDMVNKLFKHKRVIVDAVAGAGKTAVLTQAMKALLDAGHISVIYYVIFPVQEESLGYLPGGVSDKITEYAIPFVDSLIEAGVNPQGGTLDIEYMSDVLGDSQFKVIPHTYIRGRTIDDAGVIIDEAQNGRLRELKKTFTRITDSCYVGIAGHVGQADIEDSGFPAYIHHFKRGIEMGTYPDIAIASLSHDFRGKFASYADDLII